MPDVNVGLTLPGERVMVAAIDLVKTILEGQPQEVREELWRMHMEDVRDMRAFFRGLRGESEAAPEALTERELAQPSKWLFRDGALVAEKGAEPPGPTPSPHTD